MKITEFLALATPPAVEWHLVTVDQYGPLIRCGFVGAENLEVHLHLDMLGQQCTAGNVREKSTGRGTHAHGTPMTPTQCAAHFEAVRSRGFEQYHQALRQMDWTVGSGRAIPPELRQGLGERYVPWGQAPNENAIAYDPRYNWRLPGK